jgi:hypothetical protein
MIDGHSLAMWLAGRLAVYLMIAVAAGAIFAAGAFAVVWYLFQ